MAVNATDAENNRLRSMKEAALFLGVSSDTIRRLGNSGELELIKIGHRTTRVTQASLDRFVKERTIPRK